MQSIDFLTTTSWQPLARLGIVHPMLTLNYETVSQTWIVMLVTFGLALLARYALRYQQSISSFLIQSYAQSFIDLTQQTIGTFQAHHFYFIISLFTFILLCNIISIIPGLEEPTQDLNTTLALGVTSFLYIQIYTIQKEGFIGYLKSYLSPFFLMFPLNVVGKLASIVSISFRLFGNIFGGAIIAKLYTSAIAGSVFWELFGIVSGINIIITFFFGIFEGFLQAFVFAMLTVTYLAIAIKHEEPPIGDLP